MSRTQDNDASTLPLTYIDDCQQQAAAVTWSVAMLMTSLCGGDGATAAEPAVGGAVAWNWRVVPLLALVAAGVVGNTLVCVSVFIERRLHNVTNYFLVSLPPLTFKSPST